MISSKLKDGEHFYLDRNEKLDEDEKKLLMTQDLKYVMMKLQVEKKVSVCVSFNRQSSFQVFVCMPG